MCKKIFFIVFCNIFVAGFAFAAPPMLGYDTQPSVEEAAGSGSWMGSPAYPPMTLPDGAINLDDVWTEHGGARMYWNSTRYPIQLKLAGQTWVDPALVPELFTQKTTVKKKYRPRRRARPKPNIVCFPADQVPEALRPKKKAVPVASAARKAAPAPKAEAVKAPEPVEKPLVSVTPGPLEPPLEENTSVPAPRLQ